MKEFTVPMALADYVPVSLFLAASIILLRGLYNKMSKGAFALFAAGTISVFCAGFMKATYKLLYAANICDFEALNDIFFPLQALGFLLAGIGIIALLCYPQGVTLAAVSPALFKGTFIFVGGMVAGVLAISTGMSYIAFKMKRGGAAVLYIIWFICCLSMGYLSSKDFAEASMNWIAEGVNILGQGCFLFGTLILNKAGLQSFKLAK